MTDELFDFTGKVVLITGGSRGLGLERVRAFARRGANVVITSRKAEGYEAAAAEVRTMGRKALANGAHAAHWNDLPGLVDAAYGKFGFKLHYRLLDPCRRRHALDQTTPMNWPRNGTGSAFQESSTK